MHRVVAFVSLVTHLIFVAFTVIGGFVAWFMPWVLIPHLLTALWGARMAAFRPACPLSRAENWGRRGSGRAVLAQGGFVAHYFEDRVYPARWARRVELIVGTGIIGSWIGFSLR